MLYINGDPSSLRSCDIHVTWGQSTWNNSNVSHRDVLKITFQWRYNERDGVSNYRRDDCWLNSLFRRRSNKTSKLHATGLCEGNSPVKSPHKGTVTRKICSFDDVIVYAINVTATSHKGPWVNSDYHHQSVVESMANNSQLRANKSWVHNDTSK